MDGWINERMDGWMWVDVWMVEGWMDGWMNERMDRWMEDGWMGGRWMDE